MFAKDTYEGVFLQDGTFTCCALPGVRPRQYIDAVDKHYVIFASVRHTYMREKACTLI